MRKRKQRGILVAVLHNVRSVHNVGSIFRTADGAGFSEIILCGVTPEPTDRLGRLRPEFAKVALGAERSLVWEKVKTTSQAIRELRKEKFAIFALEQAPNARSCFSLPRLARRIALVVGSERGGIAPRVLKQVDRVIEIPMFGSKESLNVSVAFGIAAYELARRPSTALGTP